MSDVIEFTRKRMDIGKKVSSQLTDATLVAAGGSLSYGANFSIRESSDIDLLVVCELDKIGALAQTDVFASLRSTGAISAFQKREINLIRFAYEFDNIPINLFVYEKEHYIDFCALRADVKAFIASAINPIKTSYRFDGSATKVDLGVRQDLGGWVYSLPCLAQGSYWGLAPFEDYLLDAVVFHDPDGFYGLMKERVWSTIVGKLVEENPKPDLTKVNLVNTFYSYQNYRERLPINLVDKIQTETTLRVSRLLNNN